MDVLDSPTLLRLRKTTWPTKLGALVFAAALETKRGVENRDVNAQYTLPLANIRVPGGEATAAVRRVREVLSEPPREF